MHLSRIWLVDLFLARTYLRIVRIKMLFGSVIKHKKYGWLRVMCFQN